MTVVMDLTKPYTSDGLGPAAKEGDLGGSRWGRRFRRRLSVYLGLRTTSDGGGNNSICDVARRRRRRRRPRLLLLQCNCEQGHGQFSSTKWAFQQFMGLIWALHPSIEHTQRPGGGAPSFPSTAMPSRSSRPKPRWPLAEPPPGLFPTRDDLLRLLAVLSIAAAAVAACSLIDRRPKPFCDSDDPYAYAYDSCQSCPHNGRCIDGKLECVQGFKKYGRICIEDGLVSQTANKISQLLQLKICDEHARALCGQAGKILFQELDMSMMANELLAKDPVGLSDDGIKVAKNRVLESARGFFEATLTHTKVEAFKCPEQVAELHRPLTCQVRQWIFRNIIFVMTFCMLFAALLWILWNIYQRRALSKRAEQIYEQVCEILEDNAINAKIGNPECEPWVVTSWLRDHLLVPRERRNVVLWKKVEELILEDSRIDQYPKVIKGESKVVFEWQASGSLNAKIKKMQGATGKSRTDVGAINIAEQLGACVGEVREQSPYCSTRKEGTKA